MNIRLDSSKPSVELVLHSCLGVVFAVSVVVMAVWPQVQTVIV